jgi:hypothetical protein
MRMRAIHLSGRFRPSEEPNVGRMCWIAPDLWGVPLTTEVRGHAVHLRFPEQASDGYVGRMGEPESLPLGLSPAYFDAELDWALIADEAGSERESWVEALGVLRAGATRLTNAIRVTQPTTGLAGDTPYVMSLEATDASTGESIAIPLPANVCPPMIIGGRQVVDKVIVDRSLEGQIQIPEVLLAQAAYWIRSTPDPKFGLGVVLLAMACETKVRRVLADAAKPDAAPLVGLLVGKGNVFERSAQELFGPVAEAVLGRSLKTDDSSLYNKVGKIFSLRNGMAHRGIEPKREESWLLVLAAYSAFEWLAQFGAVGDESGDHARQA